MKKPLRVLTASLGVALLTATAAVSQGPSEHPLPAGPIEPGPAGGVKTGLQVFMAHPPAILLGKRVGLITNPSGVDPALRSTIDLLAGRSDVRLVALFGPEHGVRGDAGGPLHDGVDPRTRLPIYSLFGKTRSPTAAMLNGIDALIFDIQDTGARFYTYISTLALAMQAAAAKGIPFVVLDRPNPLGGEMVAGPVLDPRWKSFMGMYPLPILHGMTIAELAKLFNQEYGIGTNLIVVPMEGWRRSMWFDETRLPWVMPSPGIPHFHTTVLYPAMGPIGDTNLSVGVLTTKPFEFVGGTFVEPWRLRAGLEARHLGGVVFREAFWRGEPWLESGGPQFAGVEIRVTDRKAYRPVDLTLQILDVVRLYYPSGFRWGRRLGASYVFDWDMGTDQVRQQLTMGKTPAEIEQTWESDLERFRAIRAKYLLYP
jgi:uncharacterized protein YbbC (DUF1343 family)